jgi:hypothetical protein
VVRPPAVTCVVDVSIRRGERHPGWVQVHSSQALRGDLVAAVTTAGARAEAAMWPVDEWASRLSRIADVPVPVALPPPDREVEVPLDVLLGGGEALRTHRPDVLDELVRRATPNDPARLREQLVRVHTAVVGRLLAVVAAADTGEARAGWVSWLLFSDGWRSLTPVRRDGRPVVVLSPVRPGDLGAQVAAQVALVRGAR